MAEETDPWVVWEPLSLRDPASLDPAQRKLVALGWLRTEINNGGFDQYFSNSFGNEVAAARQAAHEAGLSDLVALIDEALDLLAADDPADRASREEALDAEPDFDDLDQRYYAMEGPALDAAMARYAT